MLTRFVITGSAYFRAFCDLPPLVRWDIQNRNTFPMFAQILSSLCTTSIFCILLFLVRLNISISSLIPVQMFPRILSSFCKMLSSNTTQARVGRAIRNTMIMRIASRSTFKTCDSHETFGFGIRQHGRHHHTHVQFGAKSDLVSSKSGPVPNKIETHVPVTVLFRI